MAFLVLPGSFGQLPHTSLRLLDHLVGVDARSADGGIGVGGSAIGRRGKGLALAILLITGGTKTARKSEVIGPASFAFFPHACLADFGGHAAFGRRPLGERCRRYSKPIILGLKCLQTTMMGPQRLRRRRADGRDGRRWRRGLAPLHFERRIAAMHRSGVGR
jgi:hypothetical protein